MIKKTYIMISLFFIMLAMFAICYLWSYKTALNQFNDNATRQRYDLLLMMEELKSNSSDRNQSNSEQSNEASTVDTLHLPSITPETKYTLETYDVKNALLSTQNLNPPEYLIGLTRLDVIKYIEEYMQDVPLEEFQKGLIDFSLISFSDDSVILRKSYNIDQVKNMYYIAVVNNQVVVFYADKKTICEYTGIKASDLPIEEQQQLNFGIEVKNQEELYAILENYTS